MSQDPNLAGRTQPGPGALTAHEPATWAGATWPLGAHAASTPVLTAAAVLAGEEPSAADPGGDGVTFAVHAPHATRVLLEFYPAATGADACAEFDCARGQDGIWRARIDGVEPGALYGFRCWGPNWPADPAWTRGGSAAGFICDAGATGDRFNPNKVLFDPYAREVTHNLASAQIAQAGGEAGIFATGAELVRGRPRRELDSGPWAPKGVYVVDGTSAGQRPGRPAEDAVVYEAHVRGLTAHPSSARLHEILSGAAGFADVADVPDELRGTYAGAGYLAGYLRALGVTTIELLPVQQSTSPGTPQQRGDAPGNYWGYATLAYFAPSREYASDRSPGGPTREFKQMVAAFHAAGIEVYLDVVYNHSGEGGHWAGDPDSVSFTSLGGFSTTDYYVLTSGNQLVDGATGVSNQMNFSSEATCRLTLDSLCYWTHEMGADGFRFDLAPVLGRTPAGQDRDDWERQRQFHGQHPLLTSIAGLAARLGIEVIAEAWDLWGYEVGNFPDGWAEWNGRFRDAVRAFSRGAGSTQAFIDQVNGDWAHFHDQGGPARSVNFVTAHDGFTLMDLVSYNQHTNTALEWPFGPSDGGTSDNNSWDSGGDQRLRRVRARSLLAILFFSRGLALLGFGDEYGRGQNGNNNPWALNTIGMWNNWAQAGSRAPGTLPVDPAAPDESGMYYDVFGTADTDPDVNPLLAYTRALALLRASSPELRQPEWGDLAIGGDDVSYVFRDASAQRGAAEGDRALQVLIDAGDEKGGGFLLLINFTGEAVTFGLRGPHGSRGWELLADTAAWAEARCNVFGSLARLAGLPAGAVRVTGGTYHVHPWSVAVLRQI